MTSDTAILEAARHYSNLGLIIHPLLSPDAPTINPRTKKPQSPGKGVLIKAWDDVEKQLTEEEIKKFWEHGRKPYFDKANIGLQCGKRSGVLVVDVDDWNPAVWQELTEGINSKTWLISSRTKGRGHIFFKYTEALKAQKHHDLGIEILTDGNNAVLPPSRHKSGQTYEFNRELETIEDIPEMPEELITRLKALFKANDKLKAILRKCKQCLREKFEAHQKSPNVNDWHSSTGRQQTLALMADLKANGANFEVLDLACKYIFREQYSREISEHELGTEGNKIKKPWKCDTIQRELGSITLDSNLKLKCNNCTFRGQLTKEDEGKGEEKKNNADQIKELTNEEIQAQKDLFRDRRLPLILSPDHFISLFCDWLSGLTDGYREYMEMGGLWLISSFCAGKVEVRLKQENVKPNIYVMCFGKSTTSRKTTIINRTRQIYESVTGELLPNEDFSIQGYLESLDKKPVQNHIRDEAAGFLAIVHKQYNEGFNEFECAVYDGQNFRKTLASKGQKEPKTFNIKNPYVTKLSATVFDNYLRYTVIEDFLSGREYRTLFTFPFYNKPSKPLGIETQEDIKNWTHVLERAKEIYLFIKQHEKVSFVFAPDALEYYSKVTSALEEQADKIDNSILSSVVGRSQIHILKLAMLIELGKPQISTTITKESIEIAAKAVIEYFIPTIMNIIEQLQEDAKNNQIEKVILVLRRNGGAVQHSKALHDSKLKSRDFSEVIDTLLESETIERVREVKTKKIFYVLKENKEKLDLSSFEILPIPPIPSIPLFSHGKEGKENLDSLKNRNKLDFAGLDNTQRQQNEESLSCEIEHLRNNSILQIPSGNNTLREYENSENWENRENLQSTQKSNDFSISTTQDVERNKKYCDFSFYSQDDYMHDTLLIRDLTNHAKTYYHMVVENVNDFAEDFCTQNPGYKKEPGFSIVAEYSRKLKSRGWST